MLATSRRALPRRSWGPEWGQGPFHLSSPKPVTSHGKPVPLTGPWRDGLHISLGDLSPDLVTMGYSPSVGPPALLLQREPISSS